MQKFNFKRWKNQQIRKAQNFYQKHFVSEEAKSLRYYFDNLLFGDSLYDVDFGYSDWTDPNEDFRKKHLKDFTQIVSTIEVRKNKLTFYTSRPGILIGKGGERINAITTKVKEAYPDVKISIIETKLFIVK